VTGSPLDSWCAANYEIQFGRTRARLWKIKTYHFTGKNFGKDNASSMITIA